MGIAFVELLAARARTSAHLRRTPLFESPSLSARSGHPVLLKAEHHQTTGSFKLRGAMSALTALDEKARGRGVCAASTGNHGRALAHAARALGTRAAICMSALVPANKRAAVKALGASIRIVGNSQDDAQAEVKKLVAEKGFCEIPPFDHRDVIAGQGTLGIELLEEAPELEAVLVPLSGGGLIAGVALAVKTMSPATRVIGVSMERGAAMALCQKAGRYVAVEEVETLADSLGGGIGANNAHTFAMVRDLVDDIVLVDEAAIAQAIRFAYFAHGEVIEGAAAVPVAALLAEKFTPRGPTALLLTGKNIDMRTHLALVSETAHA